MKINALTIDHYKLNNRSWEAFEADDNTRIMIKKLADILDDLEPQGNDHLHTILVKQDTNNTGNSINIITNLKIYLT